MAELTTPPTKLTTTARVVATYAAAWNEADEGKRRELLEVSWADDGVYGDPLAEVTGREELVQHIGRMLERFAGSRIVLTSGVDEHHGRIRFTWARVEAGGGKARGGIDFGEMGADGRLVRITGFFGEPVAIPAGWPEDLIR